ncbi:MAG: hypothetical protein ABSD29_13905 [Verrucomicrobiota bacterium]|jgi:hypothetical protein
MVIDLHHRRGLSLVRTGVRTIAVTITLDPKAPGTAVAAEFSGLSFEMEKMLPDQQGAYFFSPTNQPLLTLFKTLGIRSLRLGGNTADRSTVKVPAVQHSTSASPPHHLQPYVAQVC